ncbi:MAG: polysaccharide biosynthesis/export family protein [Thermoguttaceae bacterium]
MEDNPHACRSKVTWKVAWIVLVLGIEVLGGCTSPNFYHAESLPPQLAAVPVPNVKRLDLSGLAGPSTGSEFIQPGDVLDLSIAGGLGADSVIDFPVRVGDDGNALLPDIGMVRLAGLELADAESAISAACIQRGLYLQPHVAVTMKHRRMNRVTVVGAVEEPGIVELPRGQSYLLDAVVAAGGLSEDAGTNVDIRIPGEVNGLVAANPAAMGPDGVMTASAQGLAAAQARTERVNIVDAVMSGATGQYVSDNTVIVVEKQELAPVQVIGLVREAGEFDYPVERPLTVLGALALAGGCPNPFADKVYVIRKRPGMSDPAVIDVSIQKAKKSGQENVQLEPGDVVSVERSVGTAMWDAINIVRFSLGSTVPLF